MRRKLTGRLPKTATRGTEIAGTQSIYTPSFIGGFDPAGFAVVLHLLTPDIARRYCPTTATGLAPFALIMPGRPAFFAGRASGMLAAKT